MSRWMSDFASPNIFSASVRAPEAFCRVTPVGAEQKEKFRSGRFRVFQIRARTAQGLAKWRETASRWPTTTFSISFSTVRSRAISRPDAHALERGTRRPFSRRRAKFPSSSTTILFLRASRAASRLQERFRVLSLRVFFPCRASAQKRAFKILFLDRFFLFAFDLLDLGFGSVLNSGGCVIVPMSAARQ